jgi:hypothetical protein
MAQIPALFLPKKEVENKKTSPKTTPKKTDKKKRMFRTRTSALLQ